MCPSKDLELFSPRIKVMGNCTPLLSPALKNYGVTELEALTVVWAISHFHHHGYGNSVTEFTDHAAVKAILEAPNPTGKHA